MDIDLLKSFMLKHGDDNKKLSDFLGIHHMTLYYKMHGKRQQFTQNEIQRIAKRYAMTPDEIAKVFFN